MVYQRKLFNQFTLQKQSLPQDCQPINMARNNQWHVKMVLKKWTVHRTMQYILLTALLGCLAACNSPSLNQIIAPQGSPAFQTRNAPLQTQAIAGITPTEAFDWLSDSQASWQVIDVRTPQEFSEGHLKNADLINFYDPEFRTKLLEMNRHQPTIIYCRSGNRSGRALEMMRQLGFKNVYDIQGGILAWQTAGYPVQK